MDETPPSPWPPLQPATFPAPTDVTPLLKNPSHRGSSIRNRGIAVVAVCLIPGAAFHVFPAAKLETTALPLTPNPAATYDPKHPILCSVRPLTPCQFTPSPRKALLLLGNAPVSHQILLCLPLTCCWCPRWSWHLLQPGRWLCVGHSLLPSPPTHRERPSAPPPCLGIWQANIDLQHPVKHLFGAEE